MVLLRLVIGVSQIVQDVSGIVFFIPKQNPDLKWDIFMKLYFTNYIWVFIKIMVDEDVFAGDWIIGVE